MTSPTLVIGIGKGGLGAMESMMDVVDTYDIDNRNDFYFLGVDTSDQILSALSNRKSDKIQNYSTFKFEMPHQNDVLEFLEECPYTYSNVKASNIAALRQRSYARFIADMEENYTGLNNIIINTISNLKDSWLTTISEQPNKLINVWVVHSMGGGTGSGTFTTLLRIIDDVVKDMFDTNSSAVKVFGVGILSTAKSLRENYGTFDRTYFANSYGAMRELKILANANPNEPIRFKRFFNDDDDYLFKQSPFSGYFIYGVEEDAIDKHKGNQDELETYWENLNIRIAKSMLALYNSDEIENSLMNLFAKNKTLFATSSESELVIPVEKTKNLAILKSKLGAELSTENMNAIKSEVHLIRQREGHNHNSIDDTLKKVCDKYGYLGVDKFINDLYSDLQYERTEFENINSDIISDLWVKYGFSDKDNVNFDERSNELISFLSDERRMNDKKIKLMKSDSKGFLKTFFGKRVDVTELEQNKKQYEKDVGKIEKSKDELLALNSSIEYIISSVEFAGVKGKDLILDQISKIKTELKVLTKEISIESTGAVASLPIPINVINDMLNSDDESFKISSLIIDDDDLMKSFKKAADNRLAFLAKFQIESIYPTGAKKLVPTVYIICSEENIAAVNEWQDNTSNIQSKLEIKVYDSGQDGNRISFNEYSPLSIDKISEFKKLDEFFKNGKFEKITGVNPICKIFAHPEWFDKETIKTASGQECWGDRF